MASESLSEDLIFQKFPGGACYQTPLDELSQVGLTTSILLPMPMHIHMHCHTSNPAECVGAWKSCSLASWYLYCMMVHLVVMWKVHITYYLAVTVANGYHDIHAMYQYTW